MIGTPAGTSASTLLRANTMRKVSCGDCGGVARTRNARHDIAQGLRCCSHVETSMQDGAVRHAIHEGGVSCTAREVMHIAFLARLQNIEHRIQRRNADAPGDQHMPLRRRAHFEEIARWRDVYAIPGHQLMHGAGATARLRFGLHSNATAIRLTHVIAQLLLHSQTSNSCASTFCQKTF